MNLLTKEQVMRDIAAFIHEWIEADSWWFGSSTAYSNALLGYDCEVCINEDTEALECLVYDLIEDPKVKGHLVINTDILFKFQIDKKTQD